jgi:hypothetical protein
MDAERPQSEAASNASGLTPPGWPHLERRSREASARASDRRARVRAPGTAASIREGLEKTLRLQRLGISGALCRTLRATTPIESLTGSVSSYTRNVKRSRSRQMIVCCVSTAPQESEKIFHRVRKYRDIRELVAALDAHHVNAREDSTVA